MTEVATVETLTAEQARTLTDDIKGRVSGLLPLIKEAFDRRADQALGYPTWEAYCASELSGMRVPLGERAAVVVELHQNGMSQRQIGDALGISNATVSRHLNPSVTNVTDSGRSDALSETEIEPAATCEACGGPMDAGQHESGFMRCDACDGEESHVSAGFPNGRDGGCATCAGQAAPESAGPDKTPLPAGQDKANAALAAIDELTAAPAAPPAPRIEPQDPDVRARIAREREELQSKEAWSKDIARCVWLLAQFGIEVDAAAKHIPDWQPSQDIFPEKTTTARLRAAADYLYALAERWPQ